MTRDALSNIKRLSARRRVFIHHLFVIGASLIDQVPWPRRIGFCHWACAFFGRRQVLSQVVNHLGEFFVGALGAPADHIGDDAAPLFTSHPAPENDLRRMTRRAYALNSFSIRSFRELRTRSLSRSAPGCETGKQKDGEPRECQ